MSSNWALGSTQLLWSSWESVSKDLSRSNFTLSSAIQPGKSCYNILSFNKTASPCLKDFLKSLMAMHTWMLSHFSHVHLFSTLWTIARQAPLSMGFSWQKILEGVVVPFSRISSDPGIKSESPKSPALTGKVFTTSATWEALLMAINTITYFIILA